MKVLNAQGNDKKKESLIKKPSAFVGTAILEALNRMQEKKSLYWYDDDHAVILIKENIYVECREEAR